MDDIEVPPYDSTAIEILIFEGLKENTPPNILADEILKLWDHGRLLTPAKISAGKFCFLQGYFKSLAEMLRKDLRAGAGLPWPMVFQMIFQLKKKVPKEIVDACLAGAARDDQLHLLAAQAAKLGHSDGRWNKILASEMNDRFAAAKEKRETLLEDIKIFKGERMDEEVRVALARLVSLFPEDPQALAMAREFGEVEMDKALAKLRYKRVATQRSPLRDMDHLPELFKELKKLEGTLNVDEAYHLSIGLHEMGLSGDALEILRWQKEKWKVREEIWELELLNAQRCFAEALSLAQILVRKNENDPDVMREGLYHAAKAYHGLEDHDQATGILRGLVKLDPGYRDAAVLLAEWESRIP